MIDARVIERLRVEGWVVECHSPLEIRHDPTNSFATGWAAEIVIEWILSAPFELD
jgi:hypothetical protein